MRELRLMKEIEKAETKISDLQNILSRDVNTIKRDLCDLNRDILEDRGLDYVVYRLKSELQQCRECQAYQHKWSLHYCKVSDPNKKYKQIEVKVENDSTEGMTNC